MARFRAFLRTARRIAIVRAIREPQVALSARSELKTFSSFLVLKAMSKDSARCRYLNGNDLWDYASRRWLCIQDEFVVRSADRGSGTG